MRTTKYIGIFLCIDAFVLSHGAYSQSCYESTISSPTPFMGNNEEVFKLLDGTIGEIVAEYEYLYEYYPNVTICPERSILIIDGKRLSIRLISTSNPNSANTSSSGLEFIESKIDDEFEGYDDGNIYKLRNGQIWEQTSATYRYRYRYAPDVIIYKRNGRFYMQVEDMDDSIIVERIK